MTTVNVLYVPGTNSHAETLRAFSRVGAYPQLLMLHDVLRGDVQLDSADVLCIPGGFAYGDHLGAGTIAGDYLRYKLGDTLQRVAQRPVLAICNGFQIAMRAGLFGGGVQLTQNVCGTFQNIMRQPHIVEGNSLWLQGLEGMTLHFPCAHGEGKLRFTSAETWKPALRYPEGQNPDGSQNNIGGIASGPVFGLMDHPERLLDEPGNLDIFANGVRAVA